MKFAQLQSLKTKTVREIIHHHLQIFFTFGSPALLNSDNDKEFNNRVTIKLYTMWKDIKIVHRKPHHYQTQATFEREPIRIYTMCLLYG